MESVPKMPMILECAWGGVRLRFQKKLRPEPLGGLYNAESSWEDFLLLRRGWQWVRLSKGHGVARTNGEWSSITTQGPDVQYTRLLPPELAYRDFPFGDQRPIASSRYPSWRWPIFVDPALVNRAEYETISSCLAKNVPAIDRAYVAHDGGPRPYISSIVYAAYDPQFAGCGAKTLGVRWDCAGGKGYIKTSIMGGKTLLLCVAGPGHGPEEAMVMGDISTDQKTVFLREPDLTPSTHALLGQDPK